MDLPTPAPLAGADPGIVQRAGAAMDAPLLRRRYEHHLVHDVMAWWMANGPDREYGGVLTGWDNRGEKLTSTTKYTWSQGRWIWLMCHLANAAGAGSISGDAHRYVECALQTAHFIRDHALLDGSQFAYATTRAGEVLCPVPDAGPHASVYADLFAALGLAALHRSDPGEGWGELATDVLVQAGAAIDSGAAPSAPYPVPAGAATLALPMMLVGAGAQVARATGSGKARAIVARAAGQLLGVFRDGEDMGEFAGGTIGPDDVLARHRTPGHVLEAVWFMWHARDLVEADATLPEHQWADIAARACALGWDQEAGGVLRYVDRAGGQPSGTLLHPASPSAYERLIMHTWSTKLWWVHAEALYATTLLQALTGRADIAQWRERIDTYTFATFPQGPGKEWVQIRDRHGEPLEEVVALPVKDPFHIARSLLLLVQLLSAMEHKEKP